QICNLLCRPERVILHITSEFERVASLKRIKRARVAVIPNGVESPPANGSQRNGIRAGLHLLYLGRLHPIKGIENLLQAVATIRDGVTLSVCGEGEKNYTARVRLLANRLDLNSRVTF